MLNKTPVNLLQKFLCYLGLVVLSCGVEDSGEFRTALIVSIIAAEAAVYRLQRTRPRLGRAWVAPLFAFLLTIVLLLVASTGGLVIEWLAP